MVREMSDFIYFLFVYLFIYLFFYSFIHLFSLFFPRKCCNSKKNQSPPKMGV